MVDVDAIAAYIGRLVAQANWLGPKVGDSPVLFHIHQMNCVNSCNVVSIITTIIITIFNAVPSILQVLCAIAKYCTDAKRQ